MSLNVDGVFEIVSQLSEPEQIVLVARLLEAMPPESRALFMDVVDLEDELNEIDEEDFIDELPTASTEPAQTEMTVNDAVELDGVHERGISDRIG